MLDIKSVLISSGWYENKSVENVEYVINLPEVRYFYNEENGELTISRKKKFSNAKFWGATEVVKAGDGIVIGDYLCNNGLLNEMEYAEKKEIFLLEQQKIERLQKESSRSEFISQTKDRLLEVKKKLLKGVKGISAFSVLVVSGYFSYQYAANHISPSVLYTYVKNNIGQYEFKDIIVNDRIGGLTYSQVRNIDYAIENNQVEELLEMVQDNPENINYISALKQNLKNKNN